MKQQSLSYATEVFVKHYERQLAKKVSPSVYTWITHKIRHSYAVLHSAQAIMTKDESIRGEYKHLRKKMEIGALLHDIARFTQHDSERVLAHSEFEHGDKGAELLIEAGYSDASIILATKYHNKYNIDGLYKEPLYIWAKEDERKEIEVVVKLVRDADKLQNLEYCMFDQGEHFFSIGVDTVSDHESSIKRELIDAFKVGKQVSNTLAETKAERMLNLWSWKFDINLEGTKNILLAHGFDDFMVRMLRTAGVDESILKELTA